MKVPVSETERDTFTAATYQRKPHLIVWQGKLAYLSCVSTIHFASTKVDLGSKSGFLQ